MNVDSYRIYSIQKRKIEIYIVILKQKCKHTTLMHFPLDPDPNLALCISPTLSRHLTVNTGALAADSHLPRLITSVRNLCFGLECPPCTLTTFDGP